MPVRAWGFKSPLRHDSVGTFTRFHLIPQATRHAKRLQARPIVGIERRSGKDTQARHQIQRDRLNILNGRLFGSVTSLTRQPTLRRHLRHRQRLDSTCLSPSPKSGLDTKRHRSVACSYRSRSDYGADVMRKCSAT